jgi:hypothetical protein
MDQAENEKIGGKMNVCKFCGGKLSRYGWYACDSEAIVYMVCIPCLLDDNIKFEAIQVVQKEGEHEKTGI